MVRFIRAIDSSLEDGDGCGMRARRGRNEGSIYRVTRKRADGSVRIIWRGRLFLGLGKDGRYHQRAVYGESKAAVIDELRKLQAIAMAGELPKADKQTVSDFLTRWLEDSVRVTRRTSTYKLYKMFVTLHIAPQIGAVRLQQLGPQHIEAMLATMEKKKSSGRHRQIARAVLHIALAQAARWRIIANNPCSSVDKPRAERKAMRVLDEAQVRTLLGATKGDWLHGLYAVAIGTGMRQGELLALQWTDMDFNARQLSVQGTLARDADGILRAQETKTGAGRRKVDLANATVSALREQQARLFAEGLRACEWVFPDKKGSPLLKDVVLRRFKKAMSGAKTADDSLPRSEAHRRDTHALARHAPESRTGRPGSREHRNHPGYLLSRHALTSTRSGR